MTTLAWFRIGEVGCGTVTENRFGEKHSGFTRFFYMSEVDEQVCLDLGISPTLLSRALDLRGQMKKHLELVLGQEFDIESNCGHWTAKDLEAIVKPFGIDKLCIVGA